MNMPHNIVPGKPAPQSPDVTITFTAGEARLVLGSLRRRAKPLRLEHERFAASTIPEPVFFRKKLAHYDRAIAKVLEALRAAGALAPDDGGTP